MKSSAFFWSSERTAPGVCCGAVTEVLYTNVTAQKQLSVFFVCVHRSGTSLPAPTFWEYLPLLEKEKKKICQVLQMNTIITHKGLSNQLSGF